MARKTLDNTTKQQMSEAINHGLSESSDNEAFDNEQASLTMQAWKVTLADLVEQDIEASMKAKIEKQKLSAKIALSTLNMRKNERKSTVFSALRRYAQIADFTNKQEILIVSSEAYESLNPSQVGKHGYGEYAIVDNRPVALMHNTSLNIYQFIPDTAIHENAQIGIDLLREYKPQFGYFLPDNTLKASVSYVRDTVSWIKQALKFVQSGEMTLEEVSQLDEWDTPLYYRLNWQKENGKVGQAKQQSTRDSIKQRIAALRNSKS